MVLFDIYHILFRYIGSGTHRRKGKKFRFLVMERFGSDLQRILDHSEVGRYALNILYLQGVAELIKFTIVIKLNGNFYFNKQ